jgi:hypothetical protein
LQGWQPADRKQETKMIMNHLRFTPRNLHQIGPGGIVLQINVNDADTPALVWDSLKHRHSATYYCALDTGELDCGAGPELTQEQIRWLAGFETMVDEATTFARRNDPRYA